MQLENILLHLLDLDWIGLYHVEIKNIQAINPFIKVLSIEKYLRNAGFVKSRLFPHYRNVYYFRWISVRTKYPVFNKEIDRNLLCFFTSGSMVEDSKPTYIEDATFDSLVYNYEYHGMRNSDSYIPYSSNLGFRRIEVSHY
jgi:hypothetical protein